MAGFWRTWQLRPGARRCWWIGGGYLVGLIHLIKAVDWRQRLFRCAMPPALMVMSALHIIRAGGTVEMHFSILRASGLSDRLPRNVCVCLLWWAPAVIAGSHHFAVLFILQSQALGVLAWRPEA